MLNCICCYHLYASLKNNVTFSSDWHSLVSYLGKTVSRFDLYNFKQFHILVCFSFTLPKVLITPWLPNVKPRGRVSLNANTIIVQVLGSNIGLDAIQNKF